jgi:Putative peptidoglycan binding domain
MAVLLPASVGKGLQGRLVEVGAMTVAQVSSGRGIFGPQTDGALKTFQRNHGIDPTGVPPPPTTRTH